MKKILFLFLILGLSFLINKKTYSDWVAQPGITNNSIYSIQFVNNFGWMTCSDFILKTTNNGINWQSQQVSPTPGLFSSIIFFNKDSGYVVDFFGSLYKSSNSGINWIRLSETSPYAVQCMNFLNFSTGFVGGYQGFYKTTNGGSNFVKTAFFNQSIKYISFANDLTGWCGNNSDILYKTTNGGINFESAWSSPSYINYIYFRNTLTGFAGVANFGIFKSTNGGYRFGLSLLDLEGSINFIKFANENTGWAVTKIGRIYKTTNNGESWFLQYENLSQQFLCIETIDSNNAWAVGIDGLVYKTTNGGVGIQNVSTSQPDKFYLEQNYPNPFNPVTTIKFSLPQKSFIKLKVFDLLGREVANLVNENLSIGSYKYDFNASSLPSGVYFYKLETEYFSQTKKMVLMK